MWKVGDKIRLCSDQISNMPRTYLRAGDETLVFTVQTVRDDLVGVTRPDGSWMGKPNRADWSCSRFQVADTQPDSTTMQVGKHYKFTSGSRNGCSGFVGQGRDGLCVVYTTQLDMDVEEHYHATLSHSAPHPSWDDLRGSGGVESPLPAYWSTAWMQELITKWRALWEKPTKESELSGHDLSFLLVAQEKRSTPTPKPAPRSYDGLSWEAYLAQESFVASKQRTLDAEVLNAKLSQPVLKPARAPALFVLGTCDLNSNPWNR